MRQYSLLDLKTFIAVVEVGSFNQAAKQLGVSTAAVSRRILSLENALAVHLINRTTRQLSLTGAGKRYHDDVQDIVNALNDSEAKLRDEKLTIKGSLRIAVPMSFGILRVAPILSKFLKHYPEIDIHLQLEDQQTNLYTDNIDVAIRIGDLKDSSLIGTHLGNIEKIICASPDYLERYGEPARPSDLKKHNCLKYSLGLSSDKWGLKSATQLQGQLSSNNGDALREVAISGLGIITIPTFIVEDALKDGKLKRILRNEKLATVPIHIIRLSRKFTPTKMGAIIDFLKEELGVLK
ncbi:MAG: LysR family transcriptional regulator [Gammaproteobacteria bacterium]